MKILHGNLCLPLSPFFLSFLFLSPSSFSLSLSLSVCLFLFFLFSRLEKWELPPNKELFTLPYDFDGIKSIENIKIYVLTSNEQKKLLCHLFSLSKFIELQEHVIECCLL